MEPGTASVETLSPCTLILLNTAVFLFGWTGIFSSFFAMISFFGHQKVRRKKGVLVSKPPGILFIIFP